MIFKEVTSLHLNLCVCFVFFVCYYVQDKLLSTKGQSTPEAFLKHFWSHYEVCHSSFSEPLFLANVQTCNPSHGAYLKKNCCPLNV